MCLRVFEQSRLCFEPILTIITSCNTFLSASQYLHHIRCSERLLDILESTYIQPSLPLTLPAPSSGVILKFDPSNLLLDLAHNRQPKSIQFFEDSLDREIEIPEGAVEMPDLRLIRNRVIQAVFTDFYETQKNDANTKWNGVKSWDSIWQFAWVVRNALAHGGKINWTDNRISSVSWKNVHYNRSKDNGREIIFNDIGEGDLIILIDELDQVLMA